VVSSGPETFRLWKPWLGVENVDQPTFNKDDFSVAPASGENPHDRSLRSWIITCACAVPVWGFTIFWCLFHLGLGLSIGQLLAPFVAITVLTFLSAPCLYWATKQDALRGGNHKRFYFVAASYTLLALLIYIHYGAEVGAIPRSRVELLSVLTLVCIPAFYLGGYFLRKILFV